MRRLKNIFPLRFKLIMGTPRRFFWSVCRPGYVGASLALRRGTCRRCGACCRLVWRCRFFYHDNGLPACKLYNRFRFPNCIHFPIDRRDIADRDHASPHTVCGYWWAPEGTPRNAEKNNGRRIVRHAPDSSAIAASDRPSPSGV